MSAMRLRRLQADFDKVSEYIRRHPRLKIIQTDGEPPERYQLEYRIRSLRQVNDELVPIKSHLVEIALPRNYPRVPPQCRMLSPVFHPNIAPHAICVGDHWSAGEPLASLVARIGEMLAYQSYNVKSPLNGEAARWVEQHLDELPLDPVSLLIEETETTAPAPVTAATRSVEATVESPIEPPVAEVAPPVRRPVRSAPLPDWPPAQPVAAQPRVVRELEVVEVVAEPKVVNVSCPGCETSYRITLRPGLRRARCKNCQTVFDLPTDQA
ncbi:MAG: ubiquitin-conjugating enzyme E2 [Planctomycetaceae bacterium]